MKVEVKDQETFKPITIELVIESEEELCNLWHRINESANSINKNKTTDLYYGANDSDQALFNKLDYLVTQLKLKKL